MTNLITGTGSELDAGVGPVQDSQTPFHIAFCVDDGYFRAMGATIGSIIRHNPQQHFVFHVLAFKVSDAHRAKLAALSDMYPQVSTRLHLLDPGMFSAFAQYLKHSQYSLSIFSRLAIPGILKDEAERVLYLDADILCMGDMQELITLDMQGHIVAVAPDAASTTAQRVKALHLPHAEYFNSGMLLMDIRKWLEDDATDKVMQALLTTGKNFRFSDQDALNIVFNGRACYVSSRWNHLEGLDYGMNLGKPALRLEDAPVLVHFAGAVKPWAVWSGSDAVPLFRANLALTPWKDMPLDASPQKTREMRIFSRALFRNGKWLAGLKWYLYYLYKR